MFLKRILLENYRNYTSLDLSLSNDVNIFYGNNGQGKTNLLEAIFYTAIGKSFRNTKDSDVIQSGKEAFQIDIEICSDEIDGIIELSITRDGDGLLLDFDHHGIMNSMYDDKAVDIYSYSIDMKGLNQYE